MDVAGPLLERIHKNQINQADDRRVLGVRLDLRQVAHFILFGYLFEIVRVLITKEFVVEFSALFTHPVMLLNRLDQLGLDRHDRLNLIAGQHSEIIERHNVQRIGHRKREHVSRHGDGQHLILARDRLRNLIKYFLRYVVMRNSDMWDTELLAQGDDQILLVQITLLNEHRCEIGPTLTLDTEALAQLLICNELLL